MISLRLGKTNCSGKQKQSHCEGMTGKNNHKSQQVCLRTARNHFVLSFWKEVYLVGEQFTTASKITVHYT